MVLMRELRSLRQGRRAGGPHRGPVTVRGQAAVTDGERAEDIRQYTLSGIVKYGTSEPN